jgi:hypothetical protein
VAILDYCRTDDSDIVFPGERAGSSEVIAQIKAKAEADKYRFIPVTSEGITSEIKLELAQKDAPT